MIIRVTYNKDTQEVLVVSDVAEIEVSGSAVQDDPNVLEFEIAVDTSQYELGVTEGLLDPEAE